MTAIDATVIPEVLAEEKLQAVIEDGETYTSKLSKPQIVIMTASYADTTVIPTVSISGRTLTFGLEDCASTVTSSGAHGSPVGYAVLIRGRL